MRDDATAADVWRIEWGKVKEVVAWKDDVFTYDILCIGFRTGPEDRYYRCDEEQPGWDALLAALERVLGLRASDWWDCVVYPAFATNFTVLWTPGASDPQHLGR